MSVLLMFFCLTSQLVLLALGKESVACTWTLPGLALAGGFLLELAVEGLQRFGNTERVI